MNRVMYLVPLVAVLSGCLSSAPKAPVHWTIEVESPRKGTQTPPPGERPVVRLAQVNVRAPYDGTRLVVLRADGSVALDAYNTFAASPAHILRGAAEDALAASGRFAHVAQAASGASAALSAEVTLTRLALDCRKPGTRVASVELDLVLLDARRVVSSRRGAAWASAQDGNYTRAFSRAFANALDDALGE